MDCAVTHGALVAYHFATLPDPERAAVEEHLLSCGSCARKYVALRAHVDRGGADAGPSEAVRMRLRAAVEARFRPRVARRARRWLTRPVPRYQGLAMVAVVAVLATLAPAVARVVRPGAPLHDAERVDTARATAESWTIY